MFGRNASVAAIVSLAGNQQNRPAFGRHRQGNLRYGLAGIGHDGFYRNTGRPSAFLPVAHLGDRDDRQGHN